MTRWMRCSSPSTKINTCIGIIYHHPYLIFSMSSNDSSIMTAGSSQTAATNSAASALSTNVGRDFKANNQLSKVGENLYVDLHDNNQRGITESTTGIATFQVKANLGAFQLTSEDPYGHVIFMSPVGPELSEMSAALAKQYVNYRITHLSVTVRNISPFAAASGSIQLAYINDPNNTVTLGFNNIDTLLRQTNSRQVGAKDTLDLDFDQTHLNVLGAPSGWKFCKPRGIPILDRYGTIAASVRGVPAIGDGAQFVVSVAATFEFFGMTYNLPTSWAYYGITDTSLEKDVVYPNCEYSTEYGNYDLNVEVNIAKPERVDLNVWHTCYFARARNLEVKITDEADRVISFPCQVRACQLRYDTAATATYRFTARTSRMANLQRPFNSVTVKPLDDKTTALLLLPVVGDQLINDISIDEKTEHELRLFESLHRSLDDRLRELALDRRDPDGRGA